MKNDSIQKIVQVTPPAAIVDNTSFSTGVIDTRGFRQVMIIVALGALDIALGAFKLQECDTSGGVFTDVAGANFGTDSVLPSATADNNVYAIDVDMRGRKRYLDLVLTGGDGAAGTYANVFAILSRGETSPDSAEKRGLAGLLMV